MAYKINGNCYITETNDVHGHEPNGKLLSHTGACAITHDGDFMIDYGGQWSNYKLPFNYTIYNSNQNIFQVINNGIKVLKSGYYLLSATINVDFTTDMTGGIVLTLDGSSSNIRVSDTFSSGMTSCFVTPFLLHLEAGSVVYCNFRCNGSNISLLSRGIRSHLLVQAI